MCPLMRQLLELIAFSLLSKTTIRPNTPMNITKFIERDAELTRLASGRKILHLGCIGTADGSREEKIAAAE